MILKKNLKFQKVVDFNLLWINNRDGWFHFQSSLLENMKSSARYSIQTFNLEIDKCMHAFMKHVYFDQFKFAFAGRYSFWLFLEETPNRHRYSSKVWPAPVCRLTRSTVFYTPRKLCHHQQHQKLVPAVLIFPKKHGQFLWKGSE